MKNFKNVALVVTLLCGSSANASIISNQSKAQTTANGWTIAYQGAYRDSFDYSQVLGNIAAGSKVALASSSSRGSLTFDLFAATSLATLQTFTDYNSTIFSDNAYWYRNNNSVGFAPSSMIYQAPSDITNSGYQGFGNDLQDGAKRLSWHTYNGSGNVYGGWRSGLNIGLNSNDVWQRYVLVQSNELTNDVPEPASLALLGLGLAGVAAARRKSAKNV